MLLTKSSRLPDFGLENHASSVHESTACNGSGNGDTTQNGVAFNPKRVLILTKLTRLEFEQKTNPKLNESQLEKQLKHRGSDYFHLLERHNMHKSYLNTVTRELDLRGIEHRVCQRWDYTDEAVAWADTVFTAGGDGTFLLAASKVRDSNIPVIGINTDPISSEGYLCLMKKLPESHFCQALDKLLSGDFKWLLRQRIRITLTGKHQYAPIELHDQQLMYPEHRWSEHVREHEDSRLRSHGQGRLRARASKTLTSTPNLDASPFIPGSGSEFPSPPLGPQDTMFPAHTKLKKTGGDNTAQSYASVFSPKPELSSSVSAPPTPLIVNGEANLVEGPPSAEKDRVLPVLALNDVFVGESLSSRVSYYEIKVNDGPKIKQKSSGITICTGTGSTSWYFNINKMTEQCVTDLMKLVSEESGTNVPWDDKDMVSNICRRFNDQLIYSPSDRRLAYAVRDPVFNATFEPFPPRGFAQKIVLKSRCFDAHLVVDGGMSYIFNDGSKAILELHPEDDALRTVVFRDNN